MKGKIYKITFDEGVYYGSTIQDSLTARLCQHNTPSNHGITRNFNNGKIELIEELIFENKETLLRRERYYIETFECLNHNLPIRSKKEYCSDFKEEAVIRATKWNAEHKEERKEYLKKYHQDNKRKVKHPCIDGKLINHNSITRHKKKCKTCLLKLN